jgi:sulfide dehydrogenase cytochrome subunit
MTGGRGTLRALVAAALLGPALPARAAPLDAAGAPPGASSCSGCHAVRAAAHTPVPTIAGRPAAEIVAALDGFRSGRLPATVMNRIAPGFTEAEIRALAAWFSTQAPPR